MRPRDRPPGAFPSTGLFKESAMTRSLTAVALIGVAMLAAIFGVQAQTPADRLNADTLSGLAFRSIGPSLTTGRVSDVEVDPKNPSIWYVATGSGGLW